MSLLILVRLLLGVLALTLGALGGSVDAPHEMVRAPMVSLIGAEPGMVLLDKHSCVLLSILRSK